MQRVKYMPLGNKYSSEILSAFGRLKARRHKGNRRDIAQEGMNLLELIVTFCNHLRLIEQYSLIEHQVEHLYPVQRCTGARPR